jgi:hypothetical protein
LSGAGTEEEKKMEEAEEGRNNKYGGVHQNHSKSRVRPD